MKISRRLFIASLAVAGVIAAATAGAQERSYPQRPVEIVVPYAAGGGADFTHHCGDHVRIRSARLSGLVNWVDHSDRSRPGVRHQGVIQEPVGAWAGQMPAESAWRAQALARTLNQPSGPDA